jgi:hypothetical protein
MDELRKKYPQMSDKQGEEFNRMFKEYEEKTFERNKLANLIGIALNVSVDKRRRLFDAIDTFGRHTTGIQTGTSSQLDALAQVQHITQDVLNEEWSLVERQIGRRRRPH